jgi:hypothetical protein
MPCTVIAKDLNLGYAGKVSRNPFNKIDAKFVYSLLNGSGVQQMSAVPFGAPLILNSTAGTTTNTVSLWGQTGTGVASSVAANFAGVAVAEVQQTFTYALGSGGGSPAGSYLPGAQPCDRLIEGTCVVNLPEGTPTTGGTVYAVTVGNATSPIGSWATATTTLSGATAVALPNVCFTTGKLDTNLNTEITIKYAVNP